MRWIVVIAVILGVDCGLFVPGSTIYSRVNENAQKPLGNKRKNGRVSLGLSRGTIKDILNDKEDEQIFEDINKARVEAAKDPSYTGPAPYEDLAQLRASDDPAHPMHDPNVMNRRKEVRDKLDKLGDKQLEFSFKERIFAEDEEERIRENYKKSNDARKERKKAQEEASQAEADRKERLYGDGKYTGIWPVRKVKKLKDKWVEKNKYAQQFDKQHGNMNKNWQNDQQKANYARMQTKAAETFDRASDLNAEMNSKADEFRESAAANIDALNNNFERFLGNLKDGFEPLQMNLIAGHGTDLDGNLIEPSSFEINMDEQADTEEIWATVGDESDDNDVSMAGDILDLLIKECYRGMASGNQDVIDKNCLTADILTYRCESPVDASFYLGVTFDVREGYNSQGFRGKLVKHWCREMNTYKGQFDVPDGMHIQGVYETKVQTTTYSSVDEYIEALSKFSNTQDGSSVFNSTRNQADSSNVDTSSSSSSASGGFGGFNAGGSSFESKAAAAQRADAELSSTKEQHKLATLNENITRSTTSTTKMVGELSISVIRYEMFLREVKPNYIHEDFLNCFLMLPQSFFSPNAPEKFQDFIQRYGTHYVKAAKFGGQLKIVKTREVSTKASIDDFRKEMQEQINKIVGNAISKGRAAKASKSEGYSLGGSGEYKGFSAGGAGAESKTASVEDSQASSSTSGSATASQTATGSRAVNTTKEKEVFDTTIMEVSGGSHKIATSITDLYSLNFRTSLMQWLQSIPFYPKPFDFIFEPLTKLLYHLLDDMIDEEMYKTCLIDKEEYYVMNRTQQISCQTVFAQTSDSCKVLCTNATEAAECSVIVPRLLDCDEIVEQKEKNQRRIAALDTAISLYLREGLHPKSYITIPVAAPGCTTAYRISKPFDDFDKDFGESEEVDWSVAAFNNIQLQFNMKKFFFNDDQLEITPNARFIMFYDNRDRRWYTKEAVTDPLLPSTASQKIPFSELQSTETSVLGQFKLIPKPVLEGDDEFVQIRLRMGLYVEVNLKNKDILINKRSLNAMKSSSDTDVIDFLAIYQKHLEEIAGNEAGEVVGFINPIIRHSGKTPFPCAIAWANSQMFEITDDVQQCVKVTVETREEYFFVMAASLTDPTNWIYIHQTHNDLCIHKLDNAGNDEINSCAPRLQFMVTGKVENMAEQLYICIYKMGDLLSIALQRPTYNRNDKESATTILTYNYVEGKGENIMPRYFALGAGESAVKVKNIYMVEIETLECQLPFISKRIGGTFRCILECHPECSDLGCHRPNDATSCVTCRNSKFMERFEGKPDKGRCVEACESSENIGSIRLGSKLCSSCHHECKTTCTGLSEYECKGFDTCVNFKIYEDGDHDGDGIPDEDGDGNLIRVPKCIKECPVGYWERLHQENPNLQYYICEPCPAGCKICLIGHNHNPADDPTNSEIIHGSCTVDNTDCFNSDVCLECKDDYLPAVINITHSSCHETRCPHQFQQRSNNCVKAWRTIGYQNMNGDPFASSCNSDGCEVEVGKNFLKLGDQTIFDKFMTKGEVLGPDEIEGTHGIFSFQLAWKMDDCTVVVLEWKQNFNPLRRYILPVNGVCDPLQCLPNGKLFEIERFQQTQCKVSDPAAASLKKISFSSSNFFVNCPNLAVTKYANVDNIAFTGLQLNDAQQDYLLKERDLIRSAGSAGLYTFGQMTIPESGFIPAFKLDGSNFYSNEMQLSVHDDRLVPIGWSSWTAGSDCEIKDTTCAITTSTQLKTRECRCFAPDPNDPNNNIMIVHTDADFDTYCQPCDGEYEKDEECTMDVCEESGTAPTDSKDYMHHHCCEQSTAFRIIGKNRFGNDLGFNGVYELIYDEDEDNHVYQLLNPAYTGSTAKYIKRELAQAIPLEYYWVLEEGGDEKLRSSISKCPMDADKWGTPSDWDSSGGYPGEYIRPDDTARTAGFPELEIICSKGRNTCPDEFPYSYNYGGNCCISPFKSPESSRALLTPSDTNTDITIGDCLGASIECQLTGNRACRTNLKYISTSPFKALTDKKWNYNYKLCTEHCNTVYMKANLA